MVLHYVYRCGFHRIVTRLDEKLWPGLWRSVWSGPVFLLEEIIGRNGLDFLRSQPTRNWHTTSCYWGRTNWSFNSATLITVRRRPKSTVTLTHFLLAVQLRGTASTMSFKSSHPSCEQYSSTPTNSSVTALNDIFSCFCSGGYSSDAYKEMQLFHAAQTYDGIFR